MSKRACVLLAPGFEELEAVTIIDVLRRADVRTVTAAVGSERAVEGSHGITITADIGVGEAAQRDWDLVVLPGGMPGAERLRDDPTVQALIQRQHRQAAGLAAICAAPIALGRAGVLQGKRATCYPGFETQLGSDVETSTDTVVRDDTISTSRGPGTAMAFALHLVERLQGRPAAAKVAAGMLVRLD